MPATYSGEDHLSHGVGHRKPMMPVRPVPMLTLPVGTDQAPVFRKCVGANQGAP